jgi:hypothetical protein
VTFSIWRWCRFNLKVVPASARPEREPGWVGDGTRARSYPIVIEGRGARGFFGCRFRSFACVKINPSRACRADENEIKSVGAASAGELTCC